MRSHTVFEDLRRDRNRLERPGYWQKQVADDLIFARGLLQANWDPGQMKNRRGFACSPHFLHAHDCTPPARAWTAEKNAESVKMRASGFTLLEILLSLAIIALLSGALIGLSVHLLNDQPVSADEVFWKAVQEARKAALKAEHEMRLKFDPQKKAFLIVDGLAPAVLGPDGITRVEETPLKELPVPSATTGDVTVEFLSAQKGGNTILVGGMLLESQPIPFVVFYSDGNCTAFRVQITRNGAVHQLSVDPWTCAPILTPPDPNAPVAP